MIHQVHGEFLLVSSSPFQWVWILVATCSKQWQTDPSLERGSPSDLEYKFWSWEAASLAQVQWNLGKWH